MDLAAELAMRVKDYVDFGTFRDELQARKFLLGMERRGLLHSTILKHPVPRPGERLNGRHPKLLTHNWRCSRPRHDDLLKRLTLEVFPDRFTCRQVDPDILPDGEWWFGDEHYYIELDMGTMPLATIEKTRIPKYRDAKGLTIWICHEDTESLAERNKEAMLGRNWGPTHLFTTSYQLLTDPFAHILEYMANGERWVTSLPETLDETPAEVRRKRA